MNENHSAVVPPCGTITGLDKPVSRLFFGTAIPQVIAGRNAASRDSRSPAPTSASPGSFAIPGEAPAQCRDACREEGHNGLRHRPAVSFQFRDGCLRDRELVKCAASCTERRIGLSSADAGRGCIPRAGRGLRRLTRCAGDPYENAAAAQRC